jgi:gas vesicle protein
LAFLHELYHASHPRHLLNIEDELKENTQDFNRQIKRCLKKNDSNNDEHLTTLFEEYKTYHYENAKEERNATAFAIKIINKFRKK